MKKRERGIFETSDSKKTLYERRKEQGLCVYCGKEKEQDRQHLVSCYDCIMKKTEESRQNRIMYRNLGMCARCGKYEVFGDEKNCPECKAKHNTRMEKEREKNGDKVREYHRNSYRRTAEHRRENGLCTRCGGKRDDGYVMCSRCRAKNTEMCRRTRNKKGNRQKFWIENGLCIRCGDEVKKGYKVCEKHYQMNVQNSHNRTPEQIQKASAYWKSSNNAFFKKAGGTNG